MSDIDVAKWVIATAQSSMFNVYNARPFLMP